MSDVLLFDERGKAREHASAAAMEASPADARTKAARRRQDEIWVTPSADIFTPDRLCDLKEAARRSLVVLSPIGEAQRLLLSSVFDEVIAIAPPIQILDLEELTEALQAKNKNELFIGGFADETSQQLVLIRGNLKPVTVPFSFFASAPGTSKADFADFEVIDCGLTVRLGDYEAASDAILYLVDPEFRRAEKKRRLESDRTIGASIRRLRLQRKMRLADVVGVSEKEMGRIERGEVQPQQATLQTIATALDVRLEDLASY